MIPWCAQAKYLLSLYNIYMFLALAWNFVAEFSLNSLEQCINNSIMYSLVTQQLDSLTD